MTKTDHLNRPILKLNSFKNKSDEPIDNPDTPSLDIDNTIDKADGDKLNEEIKLKPKDNAIRDHCHYIGKYRGAAHNKCNLQFKKPKFTPIIFHNLSRYDSHLFIKNLGKTEGNIKCIWLITKRGISPSLRILKFISTQTKRRDMTCI